MIRRVVTITGEVEALGDKINYFIENELIEKEYVSGVKIIENYRSAQTISSRWRHMDALHSILYSVYLCNGGLNNAI